MRDHISRTASSCFFRLRRLHQLRGAVCCSIMQQLVSALVLSRLNYCNAVLSGLPSTTLDPLRQVLNAAIHAVAGIGPRDLLTEQMKKLHWLPIKYRINFVISDYARRCDWSIARNTFVTLYILCQHYLNGIGYEQLRVASSTSTGQELFSVKELSSWLVHASRTLFHKTLQISQTEKLLNGLLRRIILN